MVFKCKKILIVFSFMLISFLAYSQEDLSLYREGIKAARAGDVEFAFMNFRQLLTGFPKSQFTEKTLFSLGECYYLFSDYKSAYETFIRIIENNPQSETKIFILAYCLEFARKDGKEELAKSIKKEIVTDRQLSLLFSDFKEHTFESIRSYKAIYFIDKVEIYIDEELFIKVPY